jgi:hypothetical protein
MREMRTMIIHPLTTEIGFGSLKIKWIRVFGMVVNLSIGAILGILGIMIG